MKIKTFNSRKIKYLIPVLVIVLVISIVFILKTSYSKYEYTKSYPLASGTINYTLPDLNVIAMYQQASKGSTSYNEIDSAPTSGFEVNTSKSFCGTYNTNGGINKDNSIILSSVAGGGVTTFGLKKGTRCMIYFDYEIPPQKSNGTSSGMLTALRTLNSNIPASSGARSSFNSVISSGSYTYEVEDDLGTSYYFAGAVGTNWVKLSGIYWRIVRINGNGSVRLIYSGTDSPTSNQAVVMTGTGTQIGTSAFNTNYSDNTYVGYMYGTTGQSSWSNTHANTNNSTIKDAVDTWYSEKKGGFENYIDINVGFCGNRSTDNEENAGTGTINTHYGAKIRLHTNKTPILTCRKNKSILYNNDLYTKVGANIGNKALTYPVGLITADEIALAGGLYETQNTGYYLYTNQAYWTMSPGYFYGGKTWMFDIDSKGVLYDWYGDTVIGVRPVINLKSDLTWSGKGTWNSPFEPSL